MTAASSNLQLWKEYRIPLVCMAIGIATLSIILSKNKDNTNNNDSTGANSKSQDPSGKKASNMVEKI
ncbi:hypothetical protein BGZ90_000036, partial [Linnemannia elongata]